MIEDKSNSGAMDLGLEFSIPIPYISCPSHSTAMSLTRTGWTLAVFLPTRKNDPRLLRRDFSQN